MTPISTPNSIRARSKRQWRHYNPASQFSLNIDLNVLNSSLVSGIPGPVPDYLQNPNSYYWFSYYAANRMLYAKYNICEDDPNGINVATYSAQILARSTQTRSIP